MKYYIAKTVKGEFDTVVDRAIEALKAEGFSVLTDIDVKATMKKSSTWVSGTIESSAPAIHRWRIRR